MARRAGFDRERGFTVVSPSTGERCIRIGFGALDPDPREHERRAQAHESLLTVFRKRDPAAEAIHQHLERNKHIALRALGNESDDKG
jgi:DNA-binding GntR family transcriptional regulator